MLKVDQDNCIGCGLCASTSPDNFAMNADGKAEALKNEANDEAKEAAKNCPVNAITAE